MPSDAAAGRLRACRASAILLIRYSAYQLPGVRRWMLRTSASIASHSRAERGRALIRRTTASKRQYAQCGRRSAGSWLRFASAA